MFIFLGIWLNLSLSAKTAHLFFIYLNLSLHYTNLDSIQKSRDITSPTKVHQVKAMVFPVVIYGCESWAIKKAESRRIGVLNCGIREES